MNLRLYLVSLMASFFIYVACSPKLAPAGHFQSNAVIADGNYDDWSLPLRFSDAKHLFQYSVTNDRKNLYIALLCTDRNTQNRILKNGLNIYLDPKGDKNKTISLEYPVKKPEQSGYNRNNGDPMPASASTQSSQSLDQLLLQSDYYNTNGFINIENGQFGTTDLKAPIKVGLKIHEDSILFYEAIIPLADIPGLNLYAKNTGKNFSVGINIGVSTYRNNNNNNSRPSYGMRGMGMHMGGGGGGYRNNNQSQQPKEESEWYQFSLAYDQNSQ
jgi:hypothetical protein